MQRPYKRGVSLALSAAVIGAVLPLAGGAQAARGQCVVPAIVGVSLADARRAVGASGCAVKIRQLPPHGQFVTPASPDGRQLVARQAPPAGSHSNAVTVWVKPLCAQSALPAPARRGAEQSSGPTRLVAALYLAGGPLRTSPHCRAARPEAGTVTISTPAGAVLIRRHVRDGHVAIFPLTPGSYVLEATLAGKSSSQRSAFPRTAFTISASRTTRVNLVASVP